MRPERRPAARPLQAPYASIGDAAGGGNPFAGGTFEAATIALLARFTTPATPQRQVQINTLISALVSSGVWTKLDALYVMAAADAQAAQRNWIANSFNLSVAAGSPVFTADRGYATDGAASKLTTSFNPTTASSPKFVLDDASAHVWALDLSANGRAGNDTARSGWGSTPAHYSRANDGSTTTGNVTAAARLFSWARSAAAQYVQRVNGADFATVVVTSTALTNADFLIGETNGAFGAGPYCAYAFGSNLTTAETLALYQALLGYLTAVGAA